MALHPRLEEDCHRLGGSDAGIVLLHRNASLPWFLLVPDTTVTALYQLPREQRVIIEDGWNALAAWVHQRYSCERVNVAAIGNVVPQLHLHVIGRRDDDPCWPDVPWGRTLPPAEWPDEAVAELRDELRRDGLVGAPLH